MPRVTRRRERLEADHVAGRDPDVRLGHRCELSPQLVERIPVQPPRARFEARRVDEVRRPHVGDVNRQGRVAAYEDPCRPGVVEVDMGEEEVADLPERKASLLQPPLELLDARRRAAVVERRPVVRVDHVGADRLLAAEMEEVDGLGRHVR
jgi:hypothetical protein